MAVAGTVAPIFKGEYNPTVIYNFYNVVNHNNIMWICKVDGTVGIEPNKDNADYWYLAIDGADAASLGGETAAAWQNKLNAIQTTSSGTLPEAGWYRVAEYKGTDEPMIKGSCSNSCVLTIKGVGGTYNEEYKIHLSSTTNGKQEFFILASVGNAQYITKVRYTYEPSTLKAYLEVYCTASKRYLFGISDGVDAYSSWQAITPTLTPETVDGATVTTTYDIPANASPVTDLDIGYLEKYNKWDSSWTKIKNASYGFYMLQSENPTITDFPEGIDTNNTVVHHLLVMRNSNQATYVLTEPLTKKMWIGTEYGGEINWLTNATTSDLAAELVKYLPLSGGVNLTNWLGMKLNGLQQSWTSAGGNMGMYDDLNKKWIFHSDADGTNTFNGTATGNLALDGGGTVKGTNDIPIILDGKEQTLIKFSTDGTYKGYLGFDTNGKPVVKVDTNAWTELLHTGNSAAVAVTASAPSDTSALWYDTVNKVLKRYVDGAWQQ